MPIELDHPALIQPDLSDIIYRYLDLEKFEKLLNDSALFFCRSDKFSDIFEGSVPRREVDYRPIESKRIASFYDRSLTDEDALQNSDVLADLHKKSKKSFVVNCWHINTNESDAMWRLYLKSNEGVAIQSTVSKLIQSFSDFNEEIYMSKIRYIDYEQDIYFDEQDYPIDSYNLISPIVHKRKAFSHESELRIFQMINDAVDDAEYWNKQPNNLGINIACNLNKLVDSIILPPTSDSIVYDKVKSLLDRHLLTFSIKKSTLDDEPIY
jgi:hypothetical protein